MKLYLSSITIPVTEELAKLVGKPLTDISVALITNAKDYYAPRAKEFTVNGFLGYMREIGLAADTVDLREYDDPVVLKSRLADYDVIWAMGGNTFMLRYEMKRSGFDRIIRELLEEGVVYGGDSAGALVVGTSIAGVELADEPAFAEEIINDGMGLVPFVVMPHVDNRQFADVMLAARELHENMIELTDSQAVIFDGDEHRIVDAGVRG